MLRLYASLRVLEAELLQSEFDRLELVEGTHSHIDCLNHLDHMPFQLLALEYFRFVSKVKQIESLGCNLEDVLEELDPDVFG